MYRTYAREIMAKSDSGLQWKGLLTTAFKIHQLTRDLEDHGIPFREKSSGRGLELGNTTSIRYAALPGYAKGTGVRMPSDGY